MISVITPVHKDNPDILRATAASLQAQTYREFEWVIVPNNGMLCPTTPLADSLAAWGLDFPVRVVPLLETTDSVGTIKKFAFAQGTGDWLLELDWDDLLTPDALERVALEAKLGADFAYSNCAYFKGNFEKPQRFNPVFGWTWRSFVHEGHELDETIAMPVDAHSILWIYYAPDHLRAWRREFYAGVGGHDEKMTLADDHDLLVRTWLAGGKMVHIDRCLYLYRAEGNTWLSERNGEIQQRTAEVYRKYLTEVALRFASLHGVRALDLGGAFNRERGFQSVDLAPGSDMQFDIGRRWPLPDNSVGVIRACDVLEHIADKQLVMSEIHRVLRPGGFLLSFTPSASGKGAHMDPTHCSYWNDLSFWYWTKAQYAAFIRNDTVRFLSMVLVEEYPTEWHKARDISYVTFEAICLKDGIRPPGLIEI